jgi:hypoxanthine phosphoribosyltransferase
MMATGEERYRPGEVLITEDEIRARAAEIGRKISDDFAGEEVLVVGILKGAFMWMCDIIKYISSPVFVDFMAVSSYGASTESSGVVRILKDLDNAIDGRNVIIVEDIVDSGVTLNYLREHLRARGPKSLRICTLLDKPAGRRVDIDVDYTGFKVDDVFIVGYGLDVDQRYRNLPYITSVVEA